MTYQVKCSICKKAIGFYGFGSHVRKHKKELGNNCYIKNKKKENELSLNQKLLLFLKGENK